MPTVNWSATEKRIERLEQRAQALERQAEEASAWRDSLEEATEIIQALARLIAGWAHLPAVPEELQRQAEKFGADFSG